jgi:hypothetical protein
MASEAVDDTASNTAVPKANYTVEGVADYMLVVKELLSVLSELSVH